MGDGVFVGVMAGIVVVGGIVMEGVIVISSGSGIGEALILGCLNGLRQRLTRR